MAQNHRKILHQGRMRKKSCGMLCPDGTIRVLDSHGPYWDKIGFHLNSSLFINHDEAFWLLKRGCLNLVSEEKVEGHVESSNFEIKLFLSHKSNKTLV